MVASFDCPGFGLLSQLSCLVASPISERTLADYRSIEDFQKKKDTNKDFIKRPNVQAVV